MKSLKEYINKTIIQDNDIHDGLLSDHFYIEFLISNSLYNSYININEKYGAYEGQIKFIIEIAKLLTEDIKKSNSVIYNIKKEDLDEYGFKNIFFKEINIKVGKNYITGFTDNIKYDDKNKLFDSITILIRYDDKNNSYESLLKIITHELTHAWEEYGRYINNSSLKLSDLTSDNSNYNNYVFSLLKDNEEKTGSNICKNILYFLNKFEQNAFLSELSTVLQKENIKINDYNDALKEFKKSDTWIIYSSILNVLENFESKYKNYFCKYYNKVNNSNLTFNKIQKKLLDRSKKIFNKISTLIPKIYYDWFTEQQVKEKLIIEIRRPIYESIEFFNINDKFNSIINKNLKELV